MAIGRVSGGRQHRRGRGGRRRRLLPRSGRSLVLSRRIGTSDIENLLPRRAAVRDRKHPADSKNRRGGELCLRMVGTDESGPVDRSEGGREERDRARFSLCDLHHFLHLLWRKSRRNLALLIERQRVADAGGTTEFSAAGGSGFVAEVANCCVSSNRAIRRATCCIRT